MMDAASIAKARSGYRAGNGFVCRCPVPTHGKGRGDKNPSLSICNGNEGKLVVHCHAGCDPIDVLKALGAFDDEDGRQSWTHKESGFLKNGAKPNSFGSEEKLKPFIDDYLIHRGYSLVCAYNYTTSDGALLYQVLRYEHPTEKKTFLQRRPGDRGGWLADGGTRKVLYRWPDLAKVALTTVFVCEGEKDADRLASLDFLAVTVASGNWSEEAIRALAGYECLVLEDNDATGCEKAERAAAALHGVAASVRIVRLPGLAAGADVSDWLDEDEDRRERLVSIGMAAPIWEPSAGPEPLSSKDPERPSAADEPRPPAFTDEAVALRFAERHAEHMRHVAAWGRWMHYDGQLWEADETLYAFDQARRLCRVAAAECNKNSTAKALASAKTVAAIERLARADRRLAATISQWDANPWALNTPDGVIDLRTGKLRPHQPNDYATKITAVGPRSRDCPRWKAHLYRVLNEDDELVAYLQRVLGYALTGVTTEHALFFCYGTGANGKGVTINTAAGILKGYAQTATVETFTASHTDRHSTELAALRGARLVTVAETEEGRRWAESRIKTLTGGDPIRARFMRQDEFEFMPQLKLLISGNHKPGLRSVDEAIRRRFHLIPFTVTIPAEERDSELAEKLKPEWPAILAWMIEGCLAWQREGLNPPAVVRDATAAYLDAQDALAAWLEECCERDPNGFETRAALFDSWTTWATASGEHVGTRSRFLDALEARGFEPAKTRTGRGFRGLRVVPRQVTPHWSDR